MAAPKVDDEQVLAQLTEVFQLHGYEGASLSRLSAATGLQRASLYHRFPGGKEEMAAAVLRRAVEWLDAHVLTPLRGGGSPAARVQHMADRLDEFYHRGGRSCLLNTMSFGGDQGLFHQHIRDAVQVWLGAMAEVAVEAGLGPEMARRRAQEALVRIQGSLVLARAAGNTEPFQHALAELPALLTGNAGSGEVAKPH